MREFTAMCFVKPGMMVDQDVIDQAGRLLIARQTVLDELCIKVLLRMGVSGIYIREEEEDEESAAGIKVSEAVQKKYDSIKVEDHARVKIPENVRNRVAQSAQYLYRDTQSSVFTEVSRSIIDDLMKAIGDNDAAAVDLNALKVSDEYILKHSVDVAALSLIMAKKYGLDPKQMYDAGLTGLLHDIGEARIPKDLLNKAGKLTDEELDVMRRHSEYGYQILDNKEDLSKDIKMGVFQHHEKIDGSGYPVKVTGDKISLFAWIVSIAGIYDSLVTERSYRKPFSPREAVEMLMSMTGELDIKLMRCFLDSIILYPVGTYVKLSNGETARVVENIPNAVLRPRVLGLTTGRVYDLASDLKCASVIIL